MTPGVETFNPHRFSTTLWDGKTIPLRKLPMYIPIQALDQLVLENKFLQPDHCDFHFGLDCLGPL